MLYELKSIRKSRGMTQDEAADALGVKRGTYRNWEQCIYMPRDNATLKRIADLMGVSIEALFGYDMVNHGDISSTAHISSAYRLVPLMKDVRYDGTTSGEVIGHVPVPAEVMNGREDSFLIEVDGGMDRVMPPGSMVLVCPSDRAPGMSGCACAVCLDGGDAVIRRVKMLANGVQVSPDSSDPTIRERIIDLDDQSTGSAKLIGRATWFLPPFDVVI